MMGSTNVRVGSLIFGEREKKWYGNLPIYMQYDEI